jgi:5-methylcytosine-specific restriction endonuclease McrA
MRRTLAPCLDCGVLTLEKRCPTHTRARDKALHQSPSRSVYKSARWQTLRRRILRDHPVCQHPGCTQPATEIDHIIPIEDGGAKYHPMNLQALCKSHHSSKTASETLHNT